MNADTVKRGDSITLNDRARAWTKDVTFVVDAVYSWGVRCKSIAFHPAFYRAEWSEIAERVPGVSADVEDRRGSLKEAP